MGDVRCEHHVTDGCQWRAIERDQAFYPESGRVATERFSFCAGHGARWVARMERIGMTVVSSDLVGE